MIDVEIKLDDLLKWAEYADEIRASTPKSIAKALNAFGDGMKLGLIDYLAAASGLDPEQVSSVTQVDEATSGDLQYHVDASRALLTDADEWRRPWDSRPSDSQFEQQILLNIETQPGCCDICEQAAEEGPYTAEQISEMAAKWKDFVPTGLSWLTALTRSAVTNLLHPNCRCGTSQWRSTDRSIPVRFDGGDKMLTPDEIGHELAKSVLHDWIEDIRVIVKD